MSLSAESLTCINGHRRLFSDLTLNVEAGRVLAVHGANGSGKTTLLRILAGLLRPESGRVTWRGRDISGRPPDYHRAVAYLGHQNGLNGDLSAFQNLVYAPSTPSTTDSGMVNAVLRRVGLTDVATLPLTRLSQGQRRRAALARLLLSSRRLWLLDEPTAGLDGAGRALLDEQLTEHLAAGGMAVVATHGPLSLSASKHASIHLG